MWVVVVVLSNACLLSCVATASGRPGFCQQRQWNLDRRPCSDEWTSLLQTGAAVQKRGHSRAGEQESALLDVAHVATDEQTPLYTRALPPTPGTVFFGQVLTCGMVLLMASYALSTRCCPRRPQLSAEAMRKMRLSPTVWLLSLSCVTVQMLTTDQYLPSLGKMQVDFDTTPLVMSSTLQINWFVKGLSALSMPLLSSYSGRKPMLVLCCLCTCVGCTACACAKDVKWFMAARVLQGFAEGGETLFAMMARDMIPDADERMSYTAAYFSVLFLVPILAPLLGGIIAHLFTWRLPFLLLSVWSLMNTILIMPVFGETRSLDSVEPTKREYSAEIQRIRSDAHIAMLAAVSAMGVMIISSVDANFSLLLSNVYYLNQFDVSWRLVSLAAVCVSSSIVLDLLAKPLGPLGVLRGAMGSSFIPIVGSFLVGCFATQTWPPLFVTLCVCLLVVVVSCMCADTLFHWRTLDITGPAAGINTCIGTVFASSMTFICSFLVENSANRVQCFLFWIGGSIIVLSALFWLVFGLKQPAWYEHVPPAEEEAFESDADKTPLKPALGGKKGKKSWGCFAPPPKDVPKDA